MPSSPNSRAGSTPLTHVLLSPYAETPEFFRTTAKIGGAQRWFEKAVVSVVFRDRDRIVLSMPKAYADKRGHIDPLVVSSQLVDELSNSRTQPSNEGLAEAAVESNANPLERLDIQVGPAGRIVIPAAFRDAMQVKEGDRLMARVIDGELRLITPRMSVRLAQKLVRETIPGDDSLVDELIAERRREAEQEMADG